MSYMSALVLLLFITIHRWQFASPYHLEFRLPRHAKVRSSACAARTNLRSINKFRVRKYLFISGGFNREVHNCLSS